MSSHTAGKLNKYPSRKKIPIPSSEELNARFKYDPESGKLFYKAASKIGKGSHILKRNEGKEAGFYDKKKDGTPSRILVLYQSRKGRVRFAAQTAIWIMIGRTIPKGMVIDHKDLNPWNNKLKNLRLATRPQNGVNSNRPSTRFDNKGRTLPKGVQFYSYNGTTAYRAQINIDGKRKTFPLRKTIEEAISDREKSAVVFGEFARENTHIYRGLEIPELNK